MFIHWTILMKKIKIKLRLLITYYSQMNNQIE